MWKSHYLAEPNKLFLRVALEEFWCIILGRIVVEPIKGPKLYLNVFLFFLY